ncbi:MAG TPA: S1C family serine protease [Ktedonobacteraceae bacterium]|nr:S1C family serine protease [Ktedonobacteraceae bacterium]
MSEYILAKRWYQLLAVLVIVGILCLTLLGVAGNSPKAYADGPGGNVSDPTVRAVDIAEPAVVRIITMLNGQLIVHFASTINKDVTFPQSGSGYQIALSGSGTFITATGEILTADHVVNPPQQDLDQFLQQQAAQDVATYMNQVLKANPQVSADQVTAQLANGQLQSTSQYSTPQSRVYLSTAYTGPLNVSNIQDVPSNVYAPVDRIEKQSSFTDKDVAIIHVSNMNDMAMVQLGDSSSVQQQDSLTIIGFPGNGDVAGNTATDLLTLSINQVFVSSIKTTNSGAPLIQVGGNVEHGDSGGPALDKKGTIVGIVSFGAASGQGSTSFLQASNSASALVQSLGLNTAPGPFQKAWNQAFTDYSSNIPGHWHKAQNEFEQIAIKYPQFKGVQPYLAYATTQAKIEKAPQTQTAPHPQQSTQPALFNTSMPWIIIVVGVVLLAVVVLFGVIVFRRRRAKRTPAAPMPASSMNSPAQIAPPVMQSSSISPSQSVYGRQVNDALTAFGAPSSANSQSPRSGQPPVQSFAPPYTPTQSSTVSTNRTTMPSTNSGALVPWPCGHMNRPVARFCSVCGEPAPPSPPARKFEQ